jgi:dipeptidyl aminopeptidase/acylaminoacyl peptidase
MKRFCLALVLFLCIAPLLHAEEPSVAPNENLVVDGLPPIPTSIANAVASYNNVRFALLADWNPKTREMLISTRFADAPQIHLVKSPGADRSQLTFYPEPVYNAKFSPGGDYFIFVKDVGGGEFFQFFRYDFASGDTTLLTDGKSRNTGAVWSHSDNRIAYGSTRRNGNDVDFYIMDPRDPKTDHLLTQNSGGGWSIQDWSPDGHKLLAQEEISANESYLWLIDADNGTKTALTPPDPQGKDKVHYGGGLLSKDGKGVFVTTDRDSEFHRLTYIDLATKQPTYLTTSIHWDVDEFDLSDNGKTIAFVTNEDGYGVVHLFDTVARKELPAPTLPHGVLSNVKWHKNNRDLAFEFNSATSNDDVYSVDITTGKLSRWTESETGGLNTKAFTEPSLIHWKSFDDRSISGFLYRPPARFTGKRPVIINIHGGPEGQFRPYFLGKNMFYPTELGVAMIYPNVRGSSGYGKTFLALDNGFNREGSYKDINSLLDWIATQADLDANRVMITGGSYGGFMTLAVATNYNDRVCCSVDIVGISNLVSFLENTSGYRQDLRRVEYGDERVPEMRAFLLSISPLTKAKNITKPLFVIQGKNDPRVPMTESEQMVKTVRANGAPVWYLLAKDEGHGFQKKKNQDFQFYAVTMFVKKYLLGE